MSDRVFSREELYDLVNAENSALNMEDATGAGSGWYEFASEEEYSERIEQLSCGGDFFEEELRKVARQLDDSFQELVDLDVEDFDSEEEFHEERKLIQDSIMNYVTNQLKNYYAG